MLQNIHYYGNIYYVLQISVFFGTLERRRLKAGTMDVDAEDGRIYLPKRLREKYGDRFELVDRGDRLVLIPIDEDPPEGLREEAQGTDKSVAELKNDALAAALEDAGR